MFAFQNRLQRVYVVETTPDRFCSSSACNKYENNFANSRDALCLTIYHSMEGWTVHFTKQEFVSLLSLKHTRVEFVHHGT
jgi:hypothetical protein